MMRASKRESGVALVVTLLTLSVFSLMALGFFFMVNGEQQTAGSEADNTIAFYGAESAVENMSDQVAALFSHTASPTPSQIAALNTAAPSISNVTFPSGSYPNGGYYIWNAGMSGSSLSSTAETIGGTGPLAGLNGVVTPFTLTAIADGPNNTEVKIVRQVQEVAVPIFEFGIFCNTDCAFFAGPNFNFGGRIATNGNLFLAEGPGSTLTIPAKATGYQQVVTDELENGWTTSNQYGGTVNIVTTPGSYRALGESEGSCLVPSVPATPCTGANVNSNWNTVSLTDYDGNLETSSTGVKYLNMSFAIPGSGNTPINIVERAQSSDSSLLGQARMENQASVRILLSDSVSDLPQAAPSSQGPVSLNSAFGGSWYTVDSCHAPLAMSPGPVPSGGSRTAADQDNDFLSPAGAPLIGGYIEIDIQTSSGAWQNVTEEVLQQGIVGGAANLPSTCSNHPIIRLEEPNTYACNPNPGSPAPGSAPGSCVANPVGSTTPADFVPINIYDAREGNVRDNSSPASIYVNGVMNVIGLDVQNLQWWLANDTDGELANFNSGYLVYFSDRRGNYNSATGAETGMYGNEDIVNPASSSGAPDGAMEAPEDADGPNANTPSWSSDSFDTYGATAECSISGSPAKLVTPNPCYTPSASNPAQATLTAGQAEKNAVIFFRHALRLVNGSLGNLPPYTTADCSIMQGANNSGGFTVASENPVYVLGDYNASAAGGSSYNDQPGKCHVPAAVMGDAVTLLSDSWSDLKSFLGPTSYSSSAAGSWQASTPYLPGYVLVDSNNNLEEVTAVSGAGDSGSSAPSWSTTPGATVRDGSFSNHVTWTNLGGAGRPAATTYYRMAIMGGTNIPFQTYQSNSTAALYGYSYPKDYGTDGGVHNFLRYLENWTNQTLYYRGSIVDFYYSRQATGVYKCFTTVYDPPSRGYNFDTDFESIATLPPGTPRFTAVNALGFQQIVQANK